MIHFPRTHSPRPSAPGRPARGPGPGPGPGGGAAGRRVPGLAVRFLAAARPAPRRALCSPARLGRLPGPACLQLWARLSPLAPFSSCLKEAAPQPAVPSARVPLPPRLRGSRILTLSEGRPGVKRTAPSPRAAPRRPPARRLAAESCRFHRSRLRISRPLALSRHTLGRPSWRRGRPALRSPPALQQARCPPPGRAPAPPPKLSPPGSRAGHPPCPGLGGQVPLWAPAQPSAHSLGPAVGSSGSLGGSSNIGRQPIRP